jgi:hypothetical protein
VTLDAALNAQTPDLRSDGGGKARQYFDDAFDGDGVVAKAVTLDAAYSGVKTPDLRWMTAGASRRDDQRNAFFLNHT